MVKHRIVISLNYSYNKVSTVYLHAGGYVSIKSIIKCVFIDHSEELLILWEWMASLSVIRKQDSVFRDSNVVHLVIHVPIFEL